MSPCKLFVFVLSITPAILVGCANVEPVKEAPDPRIDQLLTTMDRCLDQQAATSAQVLGQAQILDSQSQQLESINQQLAEARANVKPRKRPAIIDCPKPEKGSNKQVVGVLEEVWLPDLELALTARMDTGTDSASLDVENIKQFERDGKRWVRFELLNPATGEPQKFELKLKTTVATTRSGEEVGRRPVIKMGVIIGGINHTAEFILYDRKHEDYQVNIGRDILKDVMVVDVSKKNIAPYEVPESTPAKGGEAQ